MNNNNIDQPLTKTQNTETQTNTLGLVAMILGIIGLVFNFCCTFMAILPGIAALVCGVIAKNNGQNYATAAIILGTITIIMGIALTFIGMR